MEVKQMLETITSDINTKLAAIETKLQASESDKAELANMLEKHAALQGEVTGLKTGIDTLGQFIKQGGTVDNRPKTFKGILQKSFQEAKDFATFKDQRSGRMTLEVKDAGDMGTGNMAGGLNSFDRTYQTEIQRDPFTMTHIRSVLPQASLGTASLVFPQLVDSEGGAAVQVEGEPKSIVEYSFETKQFAAETIAIVVRVTKQLLQDMPQLLGFLQTEMVEDLLNVEDSRLLNGLGGAEKILGIKTLATQFVPSGQAAKANADIYNWLFNAKTQLAMMNFSANGILVSPILFDELLQMKATDGKYNLPYAGITVSDTAVRVAGVPLIQTTSLALGATEFIIGDWSRTNMLNRETLNIELSYDDANNFTQNKVSIRVEERIGLVTYRPKAFLKGDVDTLINPVD
jgi:HK97 family phage major capsid protein